MSWKDLENAGDPATLKAELDLIAVCETLGIELTQEGTRWVGKCPFHDDSAPSFAVYVLDDGTQRWGCHPCVFTNEDLFSLLMKFFNISWAEAINRAVELRDSGISRPDPDAHKSVLPTVDLFEYAKDAADMAGADMLPIVSFLADKGLRMDPHWLRSEFGVGITSQGDVVIPHFSPENTVRAVKKRIAAEGWEKHNVRGSQMDVLYGVHRDPGARVAKTIILVEGETDNWTVAWDFRNEANIAVVGLPSGAKPPRREWLQEVFEGRDVILLLDPDSAGRLVLRQWAKELTGRAKSVRIAVLPEGADASDTPVDELRAAIVNAKPLPLLPPGIAVNQGVYSKKVKVQKSEDEWVWVPVTDFALDLVRTIDIPGEEIIFEVALPDGREVTIRTAHFKNGQNFTEWANAYGYTYTGKGSDIQEILRLLLAESLFVPRTKGTHVAGLHGTTFVLPKPFESIGGKGWSYIPPIADVQLQDRIKILPGDWDREVPRRLVALHKRDVITPILGWVASAPVRSLCAQAPSLAIVGGAGTGKTTVAREVLRTFGMGYKAVSPSGSTIHSVGAIFAGTNAIVEWFEEFTRDVRPDTKEALLQALRDVWDKSSSVKGGQQQNLQALTFREAVAPIVVTGEDFFSETSHAERIVIIPMPKDGRDEGALRALLGTERTGFGYDYLRWLSYKLADGTLPAPPEFLDRMTQARAVARWGWELLSDFTHEVCGYSLGEYDESRVVGEHAAMTANPPQIEALQWALDRSDFQGLLVWKDGDDICYRSQDVVREVGRQTDIKLPGGSRAFSAFLADRYPAISERNAFCRYVRLGGAASEIVGED